MQLCQEPCEHTDILRRAQEALVERFGRIERSAKNRRDPVWTLVQGVIGARTRSEVSNMTTDALLEKFGKWEVVASTPPEKIEKLLGRQTYPAQSARRLKACLAALVEQRGSADLRHLSNLATSEALDRLETLPGVGRKIAAGVMNASTFERPVIVIDSHHRRIAQRMGLVPPRADTDRAFAALTAILPPEWSAAEIDEHHLLMKELGRAICRPSRADCPACPLNQDCATGLAGGPARSG